MTERKTHKSLVCV